MLESQNVPLMFSSVIRQKPLISCSKEGYLWSSGYQVFATIWHVHRDLKYSSTGFTLSESDWGKEVKYSVSVLVADRELSGNELSKISIAYGILHPGW